MFGPESDNSAVACRLALPLVGPALSGVNGTIFAYGVTSSGKTHTMMGTDQVGGDRAAAFGRPGVQSVGRAGGTMRVTGREHVACTTGSKQHQRAWSNVTVAM